MLLRTRSKRGIMANSFYSPKTLAELYQIPLATVWKHIRRGEFKGAVRIGKHYRIPTEARLEYERKHRVR